MENDPVQATDADECPTPGPRSTLPSLSVLDQEVRRNLPGPVPYVVLGLAVSLLAATMAASVLVWG